MFPCGNSYQGVTITHRDSSGPEPTDTGADGAGLTGAELRALTAPAERVVDAVRVPRGLSRPDAPDHRREGPVDLVATDRRLLVCPTDGQADGLPDTATAVAYADLVAVTVERDDTPVVELVAADDATRRISLEGGGDRADAVVRHLRWIGAVRQRVVAARNDTELAAGQISDRAAEMAWADAERTYERHRDALDRLLDAVFQPHPGSIGSLAPELTECERTLERAAAELYVERCEAQVTLGRQLVRSEDLDRARSVLDRARRFADLAAEHAEEVRRGDAFRFGEQRALETELDRLDWQIDALAAEPLRRAHEARFLATDATEPDAAIDHLEAAFRRYGGVLEWALMDDRPEFVGDAGDVRSAMRTVATEIVDGRCVLARETWNRAVTDHEAGDAATAIDRYTAARDHLRRALDLAERFDRPTSSIADRLAEMDRTLRRMEETATADDQGTGADGTADSGQSVDDGPGRSESVSGTESGPRPTDERHTLSALRDIDTATEVTLGEEPDRIGLVEGDERSTDDLDVPDGDGDRDRDGDGAGDGPTDRRDELEPE